LSELEQGVGVSNLWVQIGGRKAERRTTVAEGGGGRVRGCASDDGVGSGLATSGTTTATSGRRAMRGPVEWRKREEGGAEAVMREITGETHEERSRDDKG
jgi:hypothetical protein